MFLSGEILSELYISFWSCMQYLFAVCVHWCRLSPVGCIWYNYSENEMKLCETNVPKPAHNISTNFIHKKCKIIDCSSVQTSICIMYIGNSRTCSLSLSSFVQGINQLKYKVSETMDMFLQPGDTHCQCDRWWQPKWCSSIHLHVFALYLIVEWYRDSLC